MTTDTNVLTSDHVEAVFVDCLFKDGEDTANHIVCEGIVQLVGLNPERVEKHRQEIHDMLAELPDPFRQSVGGGWSFLDACEDRHGNQWTGLHRTMEQLVQLGIAIGEVEYLMSREMWSVFPGGMPYFVVKQ
jgi:hypothetical protein